VHFPLLAFHFRASVEHTQDFPSSEAAVAKTPSAVQSTHLGFAPGINTCPSGQAQPTSAVQVNPVGQSHYVSENLLVKELMVDPQTLQETTLSTVKRTAFAFEQTHFS
jgi:hypothetical protein